jgi:hypothetical protein
MLSCIVYYITNHIYISLLKPILFQIYVCNILFPQMKQYTTSTSLANISVYDVLGPYQFSICAKMLCFYHDVNNFTINWSLSAGLYSMSFDSIANDCIGDPDVQYAAVAAGAITTPSAAVREYSCNTGYTQGGPGGHVECTAGSWTTPTITCTGMISYTIYKSHMSGSHDYN